MHLEVDEISPGIEPGIEKLGICALHDLVAAREIRRHPARHVAKSFRGEPAVKPEALVYRACVAAAKMLDDHVEHRLPNELRSKNNRVAG